MAVKAFTIRPVDMSEIDAWDRLAVKHGCIFDTIRWTELFEASLRRLGIYDAGGTLRGGFCVWEQRKFGLRILRNPPYTPQIGPFFESRASNPAACTDEQRAVVQAMTEYLASTGAAVTSLGLSMGITDCLPFYWSGWKVVPHYTYRIDLTQTEDALLAAMSTERRKNVRKSNADGVIVEESADTSAMRSLIRETFERQKMSFDLTSTNRIFESFPPGQNSYCMLAQMNGHPVAGVYIAHDSRTAYYLMGGYSENAHHGAGALAMWHAILKAKEMGLQVFDFEGSIIPPIERYFRGFGGKLIPIFGVHKAWLAIEMGLKMIPKYRSRF